MAHINGYDNLESAILKPYERMVRCAFWEDNIMKQLLTKSYSAGTSIGLIMAGALSIIQSFMLNAPVYRISLLSLGIGLGLLGLSGPIASSLRAILLARLLALIPLGMGIILAILSLFGLRG
jgi:hypothetical protein